MTAFVLGNGESRKDIDPNCLSKLGHVYGCNALYRTYAPTVLVATDRAIAEAIQNSGYSQKNRFYTRRPINGLGANKIPQKYYGYSSGPVATALAAIDNHRKVYMLGFDMGPTSQGRFNNVYAGTEFYKARDSNPTFTGNWIKQISTIARDFPNTVFYRVHGDTTADIKNFEEVPNIQKLSFTDFLERINTPKDL